MAFRSIKKDIDKIYLKIDKIAKKGRDNSQEYYDYIKDLIQKGQYGLFTQVLYLKYDFDYNKYFSVDLVKQKSWHLILLKTNTPLQEGKYKLLKDNDLYQIGLTYYKQLPTTTAKVVDSTGSGADLMPVIEDGGVIRIDVLKSGKNYSTASTVSIVGGIVDAEAIIQLPNGVRGGMILKVDVTATGSSHNQDIKLGTIQEFDVYINSIADVTEDEYQQIIDNKTIYLSVDKIGVSQSVTFNATGSNWDFSDSYDRNVLNLYQEAITYLI